MVDHNDGIGHGVHHEPQVALRGRGRRERIHRRSRLTRDLVLEQCGVAAVRALRIDEPDADDGHRHAEQHGGDEGAPRPIGGGEQIGQQDRQERDGGDRHQRASQPVEGGHARPPR